MEVRVEDPGGGTMSTETIAIKQSYSGIVSINKSIRDNKNVLEVRLERAPGARFNLNTTEIEGLLLKLGIDSTHFSGVSACPEGKEVV